MHATVSNATVNNSPGPRAPVLLGGGASPTGGRGGRKVAIGPGEGPTWVPKHMQKVAVPALGTPLPVEQPYI